ncbi:MAG: PAS domain-containing protein [bacterium]|nr:PAS domain-containing protein [bacterium]
MLNRLKKIPRIYFVSFINISLIIIIIGVAVSFSVKKDFIKNTLQSHSQRASLQSASISKFISERLFNGYLISENAYAYEIIRDMYYSGAFNSEQKKDWLSRFNKNNDYYAVALYDSSMNLIYTTIDNPDSLIKPSPEDFKTALKQKKPLLGEPFLCDYCKKIHIDIFAPIMRSPDVKSEASFMILLRLDLKNYIIPRINRFNSNGFENHSVIIFSDTFALNIANKVERVNFDIETLRRIKESKNDNDVFTSLFMGEQHYIAPSSIESAGWYFVSCVDVRSVSDKMRIYTIGIFVVCFSLILTVFFSLYILYLGNSKKATEAQIVIERERQTLMKHFDYLLEMADDMIFLLDRQGFIKYANRKAVQNYQSGGASLLGLDFNEVIKCSSKISQMKFDFFFDSSVGENGAVFRAEHIFKGDRSAPVEIRAKKFEMFNETYYQLIIRDMSEEALKDKEFMEANKKLKESLDGISKAHSQLKMTEQERVRHINLLMNNEKQLEEYYVKVRSIFDCLSECVIIYRTADGENFIISDLNKAVERTEQVSRERVIGKNVEEVFPGIRSFGLLEIFRKVHLTGMDMHKNASVYRDERITGVRENLVHKLSADEIAVIYREVAKE